MFLNELQNYSNTTRAEMTYRKLLKNKKYKLANKVRIKHGIIETDDSVTAIGLALMSRAHD